MLTTKKLICLLLVMATATSVSVSQTRKQRRDRLRIPAVTRMFVSQIEIADSQKAELRKIDAQFAERFRTLFKKQSSVLTDDQKKAQRLAIVQAKKADKSVDDTRKDISAAQKLTDDQKKLLKELQQARDVLDQEVIQALKSVLTEEQQKKLPKQKMPETPRPKK